MSTHPPFTITDTDLAQAAQEREQCERRMRREEDLDRYVMMLAEMEGDEDE
jgi:hypothetical protein